MHDRRPLANPARGMTMVPRAVNPVPEQEIGEQALPLLVSYLLKESTPEEIQRAIRR
jgi:hypothetical protein